MVFADARDEVAFGDRMKASSFVESAPAATREREASDASIRIVVATLDVTALDHLRDDLQRSRRAHSKLRRELREAERGVGERAEDEAERWPEVVKTPVREMFVESVLERLEREREQHAEVVIRRGTGFLS